MTGWSIRELLLYGAPWEVAPDDRLRITAAARHYSRDPTLSKRDRDHIASVWLINEPDPEPEQMHWTPGDAA